MAFDRANLGLADSGMNTTLPRKWTYKTTDTDTVVSTEGYFNNAADLLAVGDLIQINADTDGTPVYGKVAVIENASGVVDVSDISANPSTDTE